MRYEIIYKLTTDDNITMFLCDNNHGYYYTYYKAWLAVGRLLKCKNITVLQVRKKY